MGRSAKIVELSVVKLFKDLQDGVVRKPPHHFNCKVGRAKMLTKRGLAVIEFIPRTLGNQSRN